LPLPCHRREASLPEVSKPPAGTGHQRAEPSLGGGPENGAHTRPSTSTFRTRRPIPRHLSLQFEQIVRPTDQRPLPFDLVVKSPAPTQSLRRYASSTPAGTTAFSLPFPAHSQRARRNPIIRPHPSRASCARMVTRVLEAPSFHEPPRITRFIRPPPQELPSVGAPS
jgi:hypothetical protein